MTFTSEWSGVNDAESVPVTLRDRGGQGDDKLVRCTLSTLWGFFFWAKTVEHDADHIADADRLQLCSFFKVTEDPDDLDDDSSLASELGTPHLVGNDLLAVMSVDDKGQPKFDGLLSIEASTRALWAERVADSLR